ncbi:MAG: hypothetical protein ACI845_003560 [Gammaproteobacteria bacterium]|jgi:hypothetical protein
MKFSVATLLVFFSISSPTKAALSLIDQNSDLTQKRFLFIDARNLDQCLQSSVESSLCLPASTFKSANKEMPSFYHSSWVLGTLGLDGSEDLLIFSDDKHDRNLVAGVLQLAGQKNIALWQGDTTLLQVMAGSGKGRGRGITRQTVYSGPIRDNQIAMIEDLNSLIDRDWKVINVDIQIQESQILEQSKVILASANPVEAIVAFSSRLALGYTQTKVVIDQYPSGDYSDNKIFQITGLIMIVLSVGIFLSIARVSRR